MIRLEREYQLIASLGASEKRFVKLVGFAIAGSKGSKLLQLFDMLSRMKKYDQSYCETHKQLIAMRSSLPTIARRLRKLVFKCLQQLESERSSSGRLSLLLYEVEFSFHRQQPQEALRAARAGQKLASFYGRYELTLPFIDWQRRILQGTFSADALKQLETLQQQARTTTVRLERQQSLLHFQALLSSERRLATPGRSGPVQTTLEHIAQHPALHEETYSDLLTESLAQDVKGMLLLAMRKGQESLEVYLAILKRWQREAEWIREHPDLYLALFKNYQLAIFWGTLSNKRIQTYLALLPNEEGMPPKSRLDFQRIHHGHLLTLGLNTGKFELVFSRIPGILEWLEENKGQLPASSKLAFQYNICITYFLSGKYREAYRQLQPILRHSGRRDREDILDFSRVLQSVLLCQLGDDQLGEYLLRSGRKFFKRNPRQRAFEEAVLHYLNLSIIAQRPKQLKQAGIDLLNQLEKFEEQWSRPYPLGLVEVQCWLQSRITGKEIGEVFAKKIVHNED